MPGHELSGVVAELGYGTSGRNLAPLPADVDHIVAAALPISGLTAWQGLFDHARPVFFVVEPDRTQLAELATRLRDVRPLAEAPGAFSPGRHSPGKTIIRVSDE